MVFLIFRKSWGYLFNGDVEVVNLVAEVLPLVALFQVRTTFQVRRTFMFNLGGHLSDPRRTGFYDRKHFASDWDAGAYQYPFLVISDTVVICSSLVLC